MNTGPGLDAHRIRSCPHEQQRGSTGHGVARLVLRYDLESPDRKGFHVEQRGFSAAPDSRRQRGRSATIHHARGRGRMARRAGAPPRPSPQREGGEGAAGDVRAVRRVEKKEGQADGQGARLTSMHQAGPRPIDACLRAGACAGRCRPTPATWCSGCSLGWRQSSSRFVQAAPGDARTCRGAARNTAWPGAPLMRCLRPVMPCGHRWSPRWLPRATSSTSASSTGRRSATSAPRPSCSRRCAWRARRELLCSMRPACSPGAAPRLFPACCSAHPAPPAVQLASVNDQLAETVKMYNSVCVPPPASDWVDPDAQAACSKFSKTSRASSTPQSHPGTCMGGAGGPGPQRAGGRGV